MRGGDGATGSFRILMVFDFRLLQEGTGRAEVDSRMNDAGWRRPDMRNIEAGVRADGLGCFAGGLLGTPGMSASPSLVSVEKTTGATSRVIAWSIAC